MTTTEAALPGGIREPVEADNLRQTARAATDSLAAGLVFMLTLTVVQRLIGFARSILFCGLLRDDQLGRWSLAFSFLVLAAPLVVMGLPGSFGRYVEHYRCRGQLGTFLKRTILVSLGLTVLAVAAIWGWSSFWAWLFLGDAAMGATMRLLAWALVAVIVSNFVTELLTAMRKVRAVSTMQLVGSVLFALLAVLLLSCTELREQAVIIAFGVSSLVAVLTVIRPLRDIGAEAGAIHTPLTRRDLWQKLLPFAAWLWLANLLANLFDAADRFMIVHLAQDGLVSAESLVGQYHCSRIVPQLLVAISSMVAAVVLPYLIHEWEAGRRLMATRRQSLTLKLGGLALTAGGGLILLAAPLLFSWILRGKYDQGLSVLPWTLTYCIWLSLIMLAQNYLFCVERARLGTIAFFAGLMVNLALNLLLLPWLGLVGAIMATAAGNATALMLMLYFCRAHGLVVDRHVILCCSLPALLVLGPWPALAALVALVLPTANRRWLLTVEERHDLAAVAGQLWARLPRRGGGHAPAPT
jgi:polysaccharide transporter, PST family